MEKDKQFGKLENQKGKRSMQQKGKIYGGKTTTVQRLQCKILST